MTSHFKEVCEYGHVHAQCRCPDPNKTTRAVVCNDPQHKPTAATPTREMLLIEHFPLSCTDDDLVFGCSCGFPSEQRFSSEEEWAAHVALILKGKQDE